MFILTQEDIQYCVGKKKDENIDNTISGLIYKNKFFIKAKHYDVSEYEEAIKDCRENYLDNEEMQIPTLMIREEDSVSIWTQDNSYQADHSLETPDVAPVKEKVKSFANFNLKRLVEKMREDNGVNIKARRYKLKLYHHCFVGSEAVDWLTENLKISRPKAVKIGQQLMDAGIIHHVKEEHQFKDSDFFYRFAQDENKKIWTDKII